MLSEAEKKRYQRQLILPDFGEEAQLKLKQASVFIAGAGGLGGPLAFYLAAAGLGTIKICDKDEVDLSNLNRQILHATNDIGVAKSESAYTTLKQLNPEIKIQSNNVSIDDQSIEEYASGVDLIVDCLDNIPARLVLNRFGISQKIPIIHAGIDGWTAQITLIKPPETPCLRCLFQSSQESSEPKPVLGAVAGVVGAMQALEVIKYIMGEEDTLKNKMMFFDAKDLLWTKIELKKNVNCEVCSLINSKI